MPTRLWALGEQAVELCADEPVANDELVRFARSPAAVMVLSAVAVVAGGGWGTQAVNNA